MWVAAVAMVAGAAMSAVSSMQQGDAAKAEANYNNRVAQNNAQQSRDAAAVNENASKLRSTYILGTQKAAAGASGVDPTGGSPLALMTNTAQQTTLDALKIRYGGAVQSNAYINQGQLDIYEGRQRAAADYTQGASTILGAAGKAYGSMYSYYNGSGSGYSGG